MSYRPAQPAQCIIPPYLLEALVRNGTAEQRDWALRTLSLDASLRMARVLSGPARPPVAPGRLTAQPRPQPQRTIFDAQGNETLPGREVRAEGGSPSADVAVNEAYDGLGDTFGCYRDAFGRDSIDDAGMPLRATVHFGQAWDNAQWNGEAMVFGDGDGTLFGSFTASIDVIGHELTHGVTQYEAGLAYLDQSGALNESISDCFGSLVKQFALGQTAAQADWLIGADLVLPGFHGSALRSMSAPGTAYDDPVLGKDPQPATMRDYVSTAQDNGGVHINSGIPNRAFCLVATALGGHSWEQAGTIWYDGLRDARVGPNTRFAGFAQATLRAAQHAYGDAASATVRSAWTDVGVL